MLTLWQSYLFSLAVVILIFTAFPSINLFDAVSWFTVAFGVLAHGISASDFALSGEKMTIPCLRLNAMKW